MITVQFRPATGTLDFHDSIVFFCSNLIRVCLIEKGFPQQEILK